MKRRSFLKLLGVAQVVAACPSLAVEPVRKVAEVSGLRVAKTSAAQPIASLAAKGVQIWVGDLLARNKDGEIVKAGRTDHIIGVAGNTGCGSIPITIIAESTMLDAS